MSHEAESVNLLTVFLAFIGACVPYNQGIIYASFFFFYFSSAFDACPVQLTPACLLLGVPGFTF